MAFALRRQRSESEARMFTTTVRFNGCSGFELLKSLAAAKCCSLSIDPEVVQIEFALAGAISPGPDAAAADCITAESMCNVC